MYIGTIRPFGHERVCLPLCKVAYIHLSYPRERTIDKGTTGGDLTKHRIHHRKHKTILYMICTMVDQRRRRWAGVVQMLYKCFVFAGMQSW